MKKQDKRKKSETITSTEIYTYMVLFAATAISIISIALGKTSDESKK